jgi:hypothetical protein
MTHDELKELVPIFALDALPAEDEVELTAHLKFCTECSELLAEHRETAGMLAVAVGSVEAPRDLKQRILAEAARTPQLHAAPAPAASRSPVRRARRWQLVALAGTAVIALLVGGLAFRQFGSQGSKVTEQQILLARQQEALSIVSSPDSVVLPMSPNEEFPQAYGKAFVSDKDGKAAVIVSGLEEPGEDVYTLWLIADGNRMPVTDFDVDDGSQTILVDREVGSDATLAVTREPNPGNTSPQGPVVVSTYRA